MMKSIVLPAALLFLTLALGTGAARAQAMTPTLSETALSYVLNTDGSITFTVKVTTSDRTTASGSIKIVDESAETLIGVFDVLQPSIRVPRLVPGQHVIRAYYSGSDGVFPYLTESSASLPLIYTSLSVPQVDLATLQDVGGGQLVMLNASVMAQGAPARGKVAFREGDRVLATQTLDGRGQAAFVTFALDEGSHRIVAEYQGNENLARAVSLTKVVDVGSARFRNATLFRRPASGFRVISSR